MMKDVGENPQLPKTEGLLRNEKDDGRKDGSEDS
jgi:hypothetical protein